MGAFVFSPDSFLRLSYSFTFATVPCTSMILFACVRIGSLTIFMWVSFDQAATDDKDSLLGFDLRSDGNGQK